jgi:hypothetical protein
MTRIEKIPEFECIEEIYNKHFELAAHEVQEASYLEDSPLLKEHSIAEKSLI